MQGAISQEQVSYMCLSVSAPLSLMTFSVSLSSSLSPLLLSSLAPFTHSFAIPLPPCDSLSLFFSYLLYLSSLIWMMFGIKELNCLVPSFFYRLDSHTHTHIRQFAPFFVRSSQSVVFSFPLTAKVQSERILDGSACSEGLDSNKGVIQITWLWTPVAAVVTVIYSGIWSLFSDVGGGGGGGLELGQS